MEERLDGVAVGGARVAVAKLFRIGDVQANPVLCWCAMPCVMENDALLPLAHKYFDAQILLHTYTTTCVAVCDIVMLMFTGCPSKPVRCVAISRPIMRSTIRLMPP